MRIFVLALLVLVLTACGGGGSSDSGSSSSSSFTVTAIDGYLSSAEVYVDRNGDGVAGSDELIGSTDINGQIVLDNVNKAYPIIIRAVAGITRDSDYSGAIAENYEMASSAGETVVTPFTTLSYLYDIPMDEVLKKLDPDGSLGLDVDTISGDYAAINTNKGVVSQALARSMAKALKDEISNNKDSGSQTTNTLDSYVDSIATTLDTQVAAAANIADDLNETVITIETNSEGAIIPTTTSTTALDAASSGSGSSGSGSSGSGSGSSGSGSSGSGSSGSGSSGSGSSGSGSTDSGSTDSGSSGSGSTDSGSSGSGSTDSGSTDSGSTDSGSTDSGSTDSGSAPTTAPLAITNLRLSVSGENEFEFRWNDAEGATYYNLWESIDGIADGTLVGSGIDPSRPGYDDPYRYKITIADRLNAQYLIQSCNDIGCAASAPILVSDFYVPVEPFKLTFSQTKSFDFTWPAKDGATHYKLMENADGNSGFSQVGGNIASDTLTYSHIVPLYNRMNAQYILQSCNDSACTDSETISVNDNLAASVGYFKASNADSNDQFGSSISISKDGSTLAVGAPLEASIATGVNGDQNNNFATSNGAVYIFTRNNNNIWSQQAYIKSGYRESFQNFGSNVVLSENGNTLAVSAPRDGNIAKGINNYVTPGPGIVSAAYGSGAVYVFKRDNSNNWSQQAYIKSSNSDSSHNFGTSLALSADGNTLAASSPNESGSSTGINGDQSQNITSRQSGAVYIFKQDNTETWTQLAYVKASNTGYNDRFGNTLDMSADGNTLAVGAYLEASNASGINGDQEDNSSWGSGAVYVFTQTESSIWSQQAYLKSSNSEAKDYFGNTVSLSTDGSTLAVSSMNEASNATGINGDQTNNSVPYSGAVYIFSHENSKNWTQQAYIKTSNTNNESLDFFSRSLDISSDGNLLAIGAYIDHSSSIGIGDDGPIDDKQLSSGSVYIYTRSNGTTWNNKAYIKASNTEAGDYFGKSVTWAPDGKTLVIGAPREQGGSSGVNGNQAKNVYHNSGAVYLY